jgi:VanZ family protein
MTRSRWRVLLYALMLAALLYAVRPLTSRYEPETLFLHSDKVMHVAFFALLWLIARRAGFAGGWLLALAFVGYGVSIEIAQSLAPTMRSASLADVVADSAGIALGWWWSGPRRVRQPEEDGR